MNSGNDSTYQRQSTQVGGGDVVPNTEALGRIAQKVLTLLSKGGLYSVVDITNRLGISDPRGHIRDLRAKGYSIGDIWVTTHYGNRFKKYFLINK
ncbi:MAG: hypothetical protein J6R13_05865 [Alistipes sp.]|nr:hypothetical protein [Alistipes sp.]